MMNNVPSTQTMPNKIKILDVLSEAWQLTSGLKWPIFLLLFIIPTAYFILLIIGVFVFIPRGLFYSTAFFIIAGCISAFVILSIYALASLLGVKQALHLSIDIDETFDDCMQVVEKLFCLVLVWLALVCIFAISHFLFPGFILGLMLNAISLYFTLPLLIFALPLIVMRKATLDAAIQDSFRKMNYYFIEVFACYFIMMILITISAIPLGIGLIWTIPMYNAMTGILYRDAYGLKK